ncbi:hypothetical protein GOBAR_AA37521 [Gossypium barbadense]|uniref:Uncharacterized protein n=1 Tax=Gossypium barbadense TaxID=3634 RepID=A0A2P5VWG6_GOSBA|nr:hypothetical protein GOBAR_AA37521 [Gossypium barbadense]
MGAFPGNTTFPKMIKLKRIRISRLVERPMNAKSGDSMGHVYADAVLRGVILNLEEGGRGVGILKAESWHEVFNRQRQLHLMICRYI